MQSFKLLNKWYNKVFFSGLTSYLILATPIYDMPHQDITAKVYLEKINKHKK